MNHPIDSDPETHPKVCRSGCDPAEGGGVEKGFSSPLGERTQVRGTSACRSGCDHAEGGGATRQSGCPSEDSKRLKLLDTLIDKIIQRMDDNSCQPKIRDALKAIQLREKVAKTSEAEKIFWELIGSIRISELSKLSPQPTSLEAQIQETILGLKDLVKNGILPLKTVTDAFNQARSKQGRLTYRRMARLLSAMGFTRAKTPNGCSAIIWDDELLPQDTSSEAHDSSTPES